MIYDWMMQNIDEADSDAIILAFMAAEEFAVSSKTLESLAQDAIDIYSLKY